MKRALSFLLIVALFLSICACTPIKEEPTATTSTESTFVSTPETEATEPSEATESTESTDATECTCVSTTTTIVKTIECTCDCCNSCAPTTPTTSTSTPPASHVHTYTSGTIYAPKCTELGYTLYVCACGETQSANFVNATGHKSFSKWTVTIPATETQNGMKQRICNDCGFIEKKEVKYRQDFNGVTVTIARMADYNSSDYDNLWLYEQIEERFGCDIQIVEIEQAVYADKLSAMLAENNLPTIFPTFTPIAQVVELGERGAFVDFMDPEVIDKMPNFAEIFVEDEEINKVYMATAAEDGSHYILPSYDCERDVNHYWIYNETAFKKAGVEWSGDTVNGGFLNMLRQLKAYYPNSYPLTGGAWQQTLDRMIYTWGVNSSYAAYDWDKGEWYYGAITDEYYDMLNLMLTAYKENLMNPDLLTQGNGAIQDDMKNHESFLYNSWLGWMTMHNAAFVDDNVDDHEIPAPAPVGPTGKTLELSKYRNDSGVVITTKDPEAAECAIAIMDWMYDISEDGGAWLNTVGADFMLTTREDGRLSWIDKTMPDGMNTDINYVAPLYGMFHSELAVRFCPESPYFTLNEEEQMAQDIGAKIGYEKAAPLVSIADFEMADAYTASQKDIQAMTQKFIVEQWDRAKFDAWVEEFNDQYSMVMDYLNS